MLVKDFFLTIIQNENPNEKCATALCFEEGILKGLGYRPRHPNKNPNEHLQPTTQNPQPTTNNRKPYIR